MPVNHGLKEHEQQEHAVIKRKDAQRAADVEVACPERVVARVVQDAGNQEAGKHEEEVDARPAPGQRQVVLAEDHKERDGAQAVQGRKKGPVFGLGPFGVACRRNLVGPGWGGARIGKGHDESCTATVPGASSD